MCYILLTVQLQLHIYIFMQQLFLHYSQWHNITKMYTGVFYTGKLHADHELCGLRTPPLLLLHGLKTRNCTVLISIPSKCLVIVTVMIQNSCINFKACLNHSRERQKECHKLYVFKWNKNLHKICNFCRWEWLNVEESVIYTNNIHFVLMKSWVLAPCGL
jgi:hypothetical protein